MKKIRVGIVYGGASSEHAISVLSAQNVIAAIDCNLFTPLSIFVDQRGRFDASLFSSVDIVFPLIHGTTGEDGTIQGYCAFQHIPCAGTSLLGSALGMNKIIAKKVLQQVGIPVVPYTTVTASDPLPRVHYPVFVKPSSQGSSLGVHKARTRTELKTALKDAFTYDSSVLIETALEVREIECGILNNEVSVPGEIITTHEFYDYEAKYSDTETTLVVPAPLSIPLMKRIKKIALAAATALHCTPMARIDMFLTHSNEIYVNEVNTIPGCTPMSMYPLVWRHSGVSFTELITRIITQSLPHSVRGLINL